MHNIKSWSYSSLKSYEGCPHAWMYRRIIKKPEPKSIYLIRGESVHKLAEDYLNHVHADLPLALTMFKKEFATLRERNAIAEEEIVLTDKWEHLPDGWSHDEAWLRLKTDARLDNFIIDFKTGKYYESHDEQARLYANALLCLHPEWNDIDVEFWYLESGMVKSYRFVREDLADHIADWNERVKRMMEDETFAPTEHEYCKYCYVKSVCPLFVKEK